MARVHVYVVDNNGNAYLLKFDVGKSIEYESEWTDAWLTELKVGRNDLCKWLGPGIVIPRRDPAKADMRLKRVDCYGLDGANDAIQIASETIEPGAPYALVFLCHKVNSATALCTRDQITTAWRASFQAPVQAPAPVVSDALVLPGRALSVAERKCVEKYLAEQKDRDFNTYSLTYIALSPSFITVPWTRELFDAALAFARPTPVFMSPTNARALEEAGFGVERMETPMETVGGVFKPVRINDMSDGVGCCRVTPPRLVGV